MLRITEFHRALSRPNLILGGERNLVLLTVLVAATLIMIGQSLLSVGVGLLLYVLGQGALSAMAKSDPEMSKVYLRSLRYRNFYPPRSTPWRKDANAGH